MRLRTKLKLVTPSTASSANRTMPMTNEAITLVETAPPPNTRAA